MGALSARRRLILSHPWENRWRRSDSPSAAAGKRHAVRLGVPPDPVAARDLPSFNFRRGGFLAY
jgi:hypothetical protein